MDPELIEAELGRSQIRAMFTIRRQRDAALALFAGFVTLTVCLLVIVVANAAATAS